MSIEQLRGAIASLAARLADESKSVQIPAATDTRLARLAASFDLEPIDLELLVVAAAPELDERLAALLDGRATTGRALELVGADPWSAAARARLAPSSPLVRYGLIAVDQPERPFPSRSMRVPDRVVAHLLGDDALDAALAPLITRAVPASVDGADDIMRAISSGVWLCWVHETIGTAGTALAVTGLSRTGAPVLAIDLGRLPSGGLADVYREATREAALRGAGLVISGVVTARDRGALAAIDDPPCPTVIVGDKPWDPAWSSTVPFVIDASEAPMHARRAVWDDALRRLDVDLGVTPPGIETFRLAPEQIVASAVGAVTQSVGRGEVVTGADLLAGARAQNAGRLDTLARRIRPEATFATLVIADDRKVELESIVQRARAQELVRDTWGMGGGGARRGRGTTCLFAGTSGTGKTLAAEVVAHELGVDLYTIDLSQIVDKYIGETEKNLERIFVEAEGVNGVLFFDEADALFGKRSDVQSAHDRHANVEVAYLLQRMERFNGVAVLATNLRGNLDDAFTRRIDVIVHFTDPDVDDRLRLWQLHLPATLPVADDLDLPLLAKAVDVSGGVIRNITMSAAYSAAAEGREVCMSDLVQATVREYRKLGRLIRAADLGVDTDLTSEEDGEDLE